MQSSPISPGWRYLLDTNIILYPHDASDAARQARAIEVLRRVGVGPSAALPAQALAEFVNVALRKFSPGGDPWGTRPPIRLLRCPNLGDRQAAPNTGHLERGLQHWRSD